MTGSCVRLSDLDWETMGEEPDRLGKTRWKLVFSADRTETGSISMGMAEIDPGGAGTLDLHHHEPPEVYHVLEGRGVVHVGETSYELEPGVSIFIPGSARHCVENTGSAALRFLFVFPTDALRDVEYVFDR